MKVFSLIFLFLFSQSVFAKQAQKKDSMKFFVNKSKESETQFQFNKYENIISGAAAFVIGNVGYVLTDSSVLKLSYTGIQTIGIVNIGRGIYKLNTPTVETSFYNLLNNEKVKGYSKKSLSNKILGIFAKEERAKRLSIFYSSAFLSFQYLLNATVYDSPGKLKNIYIFLGGVNALIAVYSGTYKNDYEKFYYGEKIDLKPFAYHDGQQGIYGAQFAWTF
jgi:hypothetical protein